MVIFKFSIAIEVDGSDVRVEVSLAAGLAAAKANLRLRLNAIREVFVRLFRHSADLFWEIVALMVKSALHCTTTGFRYLTAGAAAAINFVASILNMLGFNFPVDTLHRNLDTLDVFTDYTRGQLVESAAVLADRWNDVLADLGSSAEVSASACAALINLISVFTFGASDE